MRQRAALLRTYLCSEGAALLDEPFSALDALTKASIHRWYLEVMEQIELSTLFITHDIDEAILLSDRIYLLSGKPGHITAELNLHKELNLLNFGIQKEAGPGKPALEVLTKTEQIQGHDFTNWWFAPANFSGPV